MRSPSIKTITYGDYVWFPILASLFWFATLLGLLLLWLIRDKHRQYQPEEATIVFISDAGAAHKALFIPGAACVLVFYTLSLLAERWLRHVDRIPGTVRSRERNWDIAAVCFGFAGGVFLVLLSIFDAFNHSNIHWPCACAFIVCVAISAICQTFEIWYLKQDHPDRAHLRRNALLKLGIVAIAICLAIAFAATYGACRGKATSPRCNVITSAAGTLEWAVAFLLSFYFLTFVLDLWPAAKTSPRHLRRIGAKEDGEKGLVGDHTRESTPRGTIDSAGYPDQRMAGEDGLRPMSERPRI